jgi:uncharacterized protein YacL (UPF0231 family)
MNNLEKLKSLISQFDKDYQMSDDHSVYMKQREILIQINELIKNDKECLKYYEENY